MNIREGLERISAAWWGFCLVLAFAFSVAVLVNEGAHSDVWVGLGAGAACIVGHRVTRWIIRGFFPAPSQ